MNIIYSPVFAGSGVVVLHETLSGNLENYHLDVFSEKWQFAPFVLPLINKSINHDVIHTIPDYAPFFCKEGVKLVITFHNYVLDSYMLRHSGLLQKIHYKTDLRRNILKSLEIADVVTAVSQATADLIRQDLNFDGEIKVINNGVDTSIYYPVESARDFDEVKVFFSGNLSARKGAPLLPLIADKLKDNVTIYYTSGLNKKSKLYKHPRLESLGQIKNQDMANTYRTMDILLLPSIREGMNLSILEAMASGLPVITSNCSSMPEQIINGEGGYLCNPGDVESFAEKINYLADNPDERFSMGTYNKNRVTKKFSLNTMTQAYKSVFNSL